MGYYCNVDEDGNMETGDDREDGDSVVNRVTLGCGWVGPMVTAAIIVARAIQPNAERMSDWSVTSWVWMTLPWFWPFALYGAFWTVCTILAGISTVLEHLRSGKENR